MREIDRLLVELVASCLDARQVEDVFDDRREQSQIGRASCRERV